MLQQKIQMRRRHGGDAQGMVAPPGTVSGGAFCYPSRIGLQAAPGHINGDAASEVGMKLGRTLSTS